MNQPKYKFIKNNLQEKIISNHYSLDSKIPSEMDLCKDYSVSRHTVRQAISELVNEGYLVKIHGSGTYVSDSYLNNTTIKDKKTIGIITTYLSDYIFPSIIRGIEKELSEHQYSLMLASTHNNVENERKNLTNMISQNVDGLIIEPTKSNLLNQNLNYYLDIADSRTPLLMLHAAYEELQTPYIAMDDQGASKMATEHLIELGHSKIAIITKADDLQGKNRLIGFINALQEAKMSYEDDYIILFDTEDKSELPNKITKLIQSDNLPTAIVCYNDQIAFNTIKLLESLGVSVPDDISIVSHDDSPLSTTITGFGLTTIEHPKEIMGREAARWIINAVEDPNFQQENIIFPPKLIIRDSTQSLN